MRLILQLIKGILRFFKKLLRYFNGINFQHFLGHSHLFNLLSFLVLNKSVIALSALKSAISLLAAKVGSSLQYYHETPDVFE